MGFYYAVVETLAVPLPGFNTTPALPGPRASDYKFTAATDGVFTFTVSQERVDRQHIFYIYAVDNQGKPDPTPARFIFSAIDRFPPLPVIDDFTALGYVCQLETSPAGGVQKKYLDRVLQPFSVGPSDTIPASDSTGIHLISKTTVPSGSRLDIHWHSEITAPSNGAVGYRYRMDEPDYVDAAASVNSVTYNSGPNDRVGPGLKIFRLRAIDSAGGKRETSRLFTMNFPPYAWFAGPDRNDARWLKFTPSQIGAGLSVRDRFVNVANWNKSGIEASGITLFTLLGPDSAKLLPHQRIERKTFFELWSDPYASPPINRIFARAEGDTVHMNSWVVFFAGGFDKDSPYSVIWRSNDPKAPDSSNNPVVQSRPPIGSPVGFRTRFPVNVWPGNSVTNPTKSGLFPIFDPASVFRSPTIGHYDGVTQSGLAYYVVQAEDGDGKLDDRIGSSVDLQPDAIVKACDETFTATPLQQELRSMIIKFYVDIPPTFTPTGNGIFPPTFNPRPPNAITNPNPYPRTLSIQMPALDPDPFVPGLKPSGPGGPSQQSLFRYTVTFKAPRNPADTSVTNGLTWEKNNPVIFAPLSFDHVSNYPTTLTLPDSLGGNFVVVTAELCDCSDCELVAGQGRCVTYKYAIKVQPPPIPPAAAATTSALSPGPGEAVIDARRRGER